MASRVLLAENTIRGLGGSYESLFITASALDRRRFEPVVLFFQPSHFAEKLSAHGIEVIVARSYQFWEREEYIQKSSKVRASFPHQGWAGTLRRKLVALVRAIAGGVPMTWRVYRVLRQRRIDILHTNNNLQRDSMMILAGILARVPIVAHERQLVRCSKFAAFLSRSVRTLICISDSVLEFTRTSGVRTRDRRRVYNAIDTSLLAGVQPTLPPGSRRIGIVGRIMPKKGQKFFIQAAALILKELPGTRFFLIGQATGADRAYEDELRALARQLGIDASLDWTGYLSDPLGLMASLDVIVHAAIEPEPFGRVIIEALALGRPVVATALGGPVEIIEDGASGFLVPAEDPAAIAEKSLLLLRDSDLSSRIRRGALRRAEDFGVSNYIRQIEMVYEDCLFASGKSVRSFREAMP